MASPMEDTYCYQCTRTWSGTEHAPRTDADSGERLCPVCGSDFVELVAPRTHQAEGQQTEATNGESLGMFQGRQFNQVVTLPSGETATVSVRVVTAPFGPQGAGSLSAEQLQGMLPPGAAVLGFGHSDGSGFGSPFPINFGDFVAPGGMEEILAQLAEQHQPRNDPACREVVDALPKLEVPAHYLGTNRAADSKYACCQSGEPCSVCHCSFNAGEKVTQLHCQHCFHPNCILPWLDTHNTCPICRAELPRFVAPVPPSSTERGDGAAESGEAGPNISVAASGSAPTSSLGNVSHPPAGSAVNARGPDVAASDSGVRDGPSGAGDVEGGAASGLLNRRSGHEQLDVLQPSTEQDSRVEGAVEDDDAEDNSAASWIGRAASWMARSAFRRG